MLRTRTAVSAGALAAVIASAASSFADTTCRKAVESATYLGERYEIGGVHVDASQSSARLTHGDFAGSVRYVRALLIVSGAVEADKWTLAIRDPQYRILQTINQEDFASTKQIWTRRFPFREVILDFVELPESPNVRLSVSEYIAMPEVVDRRTFYSTQDDVAKWRPLYSTDIPETARRWGDAVAMLSLSWGRDVWTCTGVAISESLLLTNWHCGAVLERTADDVVERPALFWNPQICRNASIDFSWDGDLVSQEFSCSAVVAKSEALDYALLRIVPNSSDRAFRHSRVTQERPASTATVSVVHHPFAEPKMISTDCTLGGNLNRSSWRGNLQGTDFEHRCDTEGGSSGAPVFDQEGRLIGLHHHGFDFDPQTCSRQDDVNKAVWITAILADLASVPSVTAEIDEANQEP